MVTEVKVIAKAQDGTSKIFQIKPGDKLPAQSKTTYKLIVDGKDQLPAGTKITRGGNNVFVEFPDGQKIEITDWCGVDGSKLIDLEGSQAIAQDATAIAAKEVGSGACMIADQSGNSAGTLGDGGASAAAGAAAGGGMSPGAIAGVIGVLALGGLAAGSGGGGGGNSAPSGPSAPNAVLNVDSDSGIAGDNTTNDTTPTISGAGAKPGDTITVTTPTGEVLTATVAADGTWSVTPEIPLAAGPQNLVVTATDPSGKVSAPANVTVTIITDPPAAPTITSVPENTNAINIAEAADGAIVNVALPPGAVAGDTVTLDVGGQIVTYTVLAADVVSGNAPVVVSQAVLQSVAGGPTGTANDVPVTATLTDRAGNVSAPSASSPINIDFTAPAAPGALDLATASDSGTNTTDDTTSDTTPTISGAPVDPGATVTLYDSDGTTVLGTTVADGSGNWSITPDTALSPGVHNFTTKQTDAAGNLSAASAPLAVTIDTAAPAAPTITSVPENSNAINIAEAADGTIINVALPVGTVAGDTVTLNVGGQPVTYTVLAADVISGNAPVLVSKAILETVAGGPSGTANNVPVSATVTDLAGNVSTPSANFPINIDFTAPAAPGALDLATASDSGTNTADNITSDPTPTISGAPVAAGATVTLYDSDGTTVLGTTVADGTGNWSITPVTPLAPGVHNFTTKQTDAAGNLSAASAPLAVTIDTAGPAFGNPAAVNEGFANVVLNSTTLSGTDNVTAPAGLEVISAVFKSSDTFVVGDLSFGAPAAGGITMTRTGGATQNGTVVVTVQMRDAAGNVTTQDVTVTVNSVNAAPAGANNTVTATEDTPFLFAASDFGFSDTADSPANALQGVQITTLPAAGTLFNDANHNDIVDPGETITAGTIVSAADIADDHLKFIGAPNAFGPGYANLTFQVQDNGGTANGGVDLDPTVRTMTVNVTEANDPSVNTVPALAVGPVAVGATNAIPGISVSDPDETTGIAAHRIQSVKLTLNLPDGVTLDDGTLAATNTGGGTAVWDPVTKTLTVTGTQAGINATLATLSYTDGAGLPGDALVKMVTTDVSGATQAAEFTVSVFENFGATPGDDTVDLGAGNDVAVGGAGNDNFIGGTGGDLLIGDSGHIRNYSFEYTVGAGAGVTRTNDGTAPNAFDFVTGEVPGWSNQNTAQTVQLNTYDPATPGVINTPLRPADNPGAGLATMDSTADGADTYTVQGYVVSGQTYELRMVATVNDKNGANNIINMKLNGTDLFFTSDAASASFTKTSLGPAGEAFGNWTEYTKSFTAAASGFVTFTFINNGGDAFGNMVDTVTLDQTGGTDADILSGGIGNDRLYGGLDNDTLTGGADNDLFIYSMRREVNQGTDTITDFNVAQDKIRLIDVLDLVAPQSAVAGPSNLANLTVADLTADPSLSNADQRITGYSEAGAVGTLTFANGSVINATGLGGNGYLGGSVSASLSNLLAAGVLEMTTDGLTLT